jgi:aspartyl-tRNA(Asn)/glutamyl-tRNA(Gln) amidotransferase subunit A
LTPHYATIRELGRMLRSGETTPTALTRAVLERLETVGRRLNAVVTITEERAMREAEIAEHELGAGLDRGPLHGIPYGVKDLLATRGYPTTWGAEPYREQVLDFDAHVISRLQSAGAVLVAKLAMMELAGGGGWEQPNASFTGVCVTPWNEQAFSGGSSSGSGAAVAAGAVPFAIGSDTRGSIHHPSANCGIAGLRPTYGRVSRHGTMALSWSLDKIGPMARSADDCGLVLDAIAGYDPRDPSSADRPYAYSPHMQPSRGFRFGVLTSHLDDLQKPVRRNFERSLDVLGEIGTLETTTLPDMPYAEASNVIIRSEMTAAFEEFLLGGAVGRLTAPEGPINPLEGLAIPAFAYLKALRLRRVMSKAVVQAIAPYDALVYPTASHVAPPIEGAINDYYGPIGRPPLYGPPVSLAGIPGLVVPNGFGERGLPTSLSFAGAPYAENTLFAIGNALQSLTGWHTKHPPI